MTTLYHHPASTASRFIRLALNEYGFDHDLLEVQVWEAKTDFLTLNPAGTLPVYIDDSMRAVCGASVICEYLDEIHGVVKHDKRLFADDPYQRAEIRRLNEWFLIKMERDVTRPLVCERIMKLQMPANKGGGAPDSRILRIARSNIREHMRYISWLAGTRRWFAGDRLSYADLAGAGAISILDYMGEIDWSHFPDAKEWYQRLKSRPAFRPLLADRLRGLPPVSHYSDLDF